MTDSSENDDWAELARELARDKPAPPPLPAAEPADDDNGFSEGVTESEEFDEGLDAGAGSETEPNGEPGAEDGQPGTGRKRRRRRRRRRKGGAQPAGIAAGESEDGTDDAETTDSADEGTAEGEFEPVADGGYQDEDDVNSDSDDLAGDAEADEDAGGELLRELIASWNVPSWDDVVGGLYRPER